MHVLIMYVWQMATRPPSVSTEDKTTIVTDAPVIETKKTAIPALQLDDSPIPQEVRNMFSELIDGGKIDLIKSLITAGIGYDQYLHAAAAHYGEEKLLGFLAALHPVNTWNPHVPMMAAYKQKWEILQWLLDRGCPINKRVIAYAAEHGNLKMLKKLCIDFPMMYFDSDDTSNIIAIIGKSCISGASCSAVVDWIEQSSDRFDWKTDSNYISAVGHGSVRTLNWLYDKGYTIRPTTLPFLIKMAADNPRVSDWIRVMRGSLVTGSNVTY
jgi:hypothetical protein